MPEAVVAAGTSVHDFATRAEAPGSFVHRHVPRAGAGIPCPDGTFMPPLNGVLASDPIPRIEREPFMPPIGEIVGKWTDSDGAAWWVTEDGSAFTTRWVSVVDADGRARQLVRLDQSDRLREGLGRDR